MADKNIISVGTLRQFLTNLKTIFSAKEHSHDMTDVNELQTSLSGKANSTHSHGITDVTGLQTALNGKQPTGSYLTTETDPTVPSYVKNITEDQIAGWDSAAAAPKEETDPTVPSHVKNITSAQITKWDKALQIESDPTVPSWAKNPTKPTYVYSEVGAAPASHDHDIDDVIGLQNALDNKQPVGNYLTEESDPTVPSWAKAAQKPTYIAAEVGAPSTTDFTTHTGDTTKHITADERAAWNAKAETSDIPTVPEKLPNPQSMIIGFNGVTKGTYDGSTEVKLNITAGAIGAATIDLLNMRAKKPVTRTYTVLVSDWNNEKPYRTTAYGGAYDAAVPIWVSPDPTSIAKWAEYGLFAAQDADGKFYITTNGNSKPDDDIVVNTVVIE